MFRTHARLATAVALMALIGTACSSSSASSSTTTASPATTAAPATTSETATTDAPPATTEAPATTTAPTETVTLVAYDSFPAKDPENAVWKAIAEFTADTGIEVELLQAGDTGTMISKAALTAGNPEGDVMWGVDNTFLSRALDAQVFAPYQAAGLGDIDPTLSALVPNGEATAVDFGDVCVNYDIARLNELGLEPPAGFDDLVKPEYASELVVQHPASSSPGMAFMLATIAEKGEGWPDYWKQLTDHGVEVSEGWTSAYYEAFSAHGGDNALVVSYGSSPPFEVLYADPATDTSPTGVVESTCFRQVEFAGVLAGTDAPDAARKLVDFLVSERFQREVALGVYVFPSNSTVALDQVFADHAVIADDPLTVDPADINANRVEWLETWSATTGQ